MILCDQNHPCASSFASTRSGGLPVGRIGRMVGGALVLALTLAAASGRLVAQACAAEDHVGVVNAVEVRAAEVRAEAIPSISSGATPQLLVGGRPFVMLAGELHNSSASGEEYLAELWPRLVELRLNTVLAPVSWELIEPEEDRFDFRLVDALLKLARAHDQRLVLLWFGSWKNGVSSYAPLWVLRDTRRFPRARGSSNQNTKDVLSTLSENNVRADAKAFARLMRHLREADSATRTVVMVQVENEVGIKPEVRDQSDEATRAYLSPVPAGLIDELARRKDSLHPELRARWAKSDFARSGNWAELFGNDAGAEELFSAWCYARYIERVAAAGKAEYPLPMFVNAWLEGKPGSYPQGGPVAHVHDIWRIAAPGLAILAPDIYTGEFKEVCARYARNGNPLFVPEAARDAAAAARAYWVIAEHRGLGFSPFGIESMPKEHPLAATYAILRNLMPLLTRSQAEQRIIGVYRQGNEADPPPARCGDYRVHLRYLDRLGENAPPVGGLVMQTGDEELIVAGYGFSCRFQAEGPGPRHTAIGAVEWGEFDAQEKWQPRLRLNGDETGAHGAVRIPPFPGNEQLGARRPMILKVRLFRYE